MSCWMHIKQPNRKQFNRDYNWCTCLPPIIQELRNMLSYLKAEFWGYVHWFNFLNLKSQYIVWMLSVNLQKRSIFILDIAVMLCEQESTNVVVDTEMDYMGSISHWPILSKKVPVISCCKHSLPNPFLGIFTQFAYTGIITGISRSYIWDIQLSIPSLSDIWEFDELSVISINNYCLNDELPGEWRISSVSLWGWTSENIS